MTAPKNPKPKKLPRRTMTMADKADDGKRNHSVTRGKSTDSPPSTHRSRAHNDANAMRRVLDDEADNTEFAETVALETALDDARSARQRFHAIRRSITGGFDNGALILACVLAVCAFAVVLVAIAAMYAPERTTPSERRLQPNAPIIVCANGPCTSAQPTAEPTAKPTESLAPEVFEGATPQALTGPVCADDQALIHGQCVPLAGLFTSATIGGTTVPTLACQEDEVIGYVGNDSLGCVHVEGRTLEPINPNTY